MNLYELIENLNLDRNTINRTAVNQVIKENYTDSQLVKLCNVFLKGIGAQHQVNGDVIHVLMGICDYYREHHVLTPKQQVYLIQNIINEWHQINLEMRTALCL